MNPRWVVALVAVAVLGGGTVVAVQLASDGDGGDDASPSVPTVTAPRVDPGARRDRDTTTTSTTTTVPAPVSAVNARAVEVAELAAPVALATRAGDAALYVAEKRGRVVRLSGDADPETVLDIAGEVSSGNEQGLLGIEFSPDGGFLYVNFTNRSGDTRLVEYEMRADGPDPSSRRQVLAVDQPFANHNAGDLAFGPDGFLYVPLGDGGSGGDPMGNGQDLSTLLGKILRILPRPTGGSPYAVPSDNPFIGDEGAREEIWAYGLRNPWRISFDRKTGDLWIGDVGQDALEEIDFQRARSKGGENYGWNRMEGTRTFSGREPTDHEPPIHEYANAAGTCAVTGGYVYRGQAIPDLEGVYVFADFCEGDLKGIRQSGGRAVDVADLGIHVDQIASFGEDGDGELYVLSLSGGLFRLEPA